MRIGGEEKKSNRPGLELLTSPPSSPVAVPLLHWQACGQNKNAPGLLSRRFGVAAVPSDRRIGAWGEQVPLLSAGRETHGCLKRSRRRVRRLRSPQPGDAEEVFFFNFRSSFFACPDIKHFES